jgi:heme-degrading monooxygenase HmoA
MFAVVYRWRIKPGLEAKFEEGWRRGTLAIRRDLGGWGSRRADAV